MAVKLQEATIQAEEEMLHASLVHLQGLSQLAGVYAQQDLQGPHVVHLRLDQLYEGEGLV